MNKRKLKQITDKKCLEQWSLVIRERAKYKCECCGSVKAVGAHHVFSKRAYSWLRFRIDNGVSLCWYCHIARLHRQGDPAILVKIIKKRGVEWFLNLLEDATRPEKREFDYAQVYEILKAIVTKDIVSDS